MKIFFRSKGLMASMGLLLLATGCGPSKVAQCNDFIEVSNALGTRGETLGTELEAELESKLASMNSSGTPDFGAIATDLNTAADTIDGKMGAFLEEANTQLSGVALQDETLKQAQTDYTELINSMGTRVGDMTQAVRDMGTVIGGIDPSTLTSMAQVEKLQADIEKAEANVNQAVEGLNELESQEDELVAEINTYCGVEP